MTDENEEELLRSVALQNAQAILLARQRAEQELIQAKEALEEKTEELAHAKELLQQLLTQEKLAREAAEHATRSKDDFLALVSHELRNPLSAIIGYARMVCSNPHDATQVMRYCRIIERSAKTQQRLIEDLLDTARIITGKLKLNAAPIDLLLVLEDALDVVRPAASAKQIDLVARLGAEPQPIIGDAARLQQVVWNLLQNAIKFTPDGGRVELRLERAAGQVRIIVSDTGIGIEPEFLPAVFNRFSQKDTSRTRLYSGLGLGLSLVKELVELHGGLIEVASAGAGQGATFTVMLPLRAPQIAEHPPPAPVITEVQTSSGAIPLEDLPRLDGVRVLLVDDKEDARLMIAATLGDRGAAVTAVASGQQARAIMADATFDVLVCDIAMPDEDGYEVIGRIRALENQRGAPVSQRLPAIALTALARPEDRMQALEAGFQMHVAKPVELAELVIVIKNLVRRI